MTVGPTLGPEHCIIGQETQQLPHSDPSYRRSLLVEVREVERKKEIEKERYRKDHNNRH